MTTTDTLFHNPIALFRHSGKCFLRRNLHTIKTGSHSHILIHSQVQILLIHVSWRATPLDFLKLVKVKLTLSCTQHTPENQHSQPLKDTTKLQYVQKRRWALASLQTISPPPASPREFLSIFHPKSHDTKHC